MDYGGEKALVRVDNRLIPSISTSLSACGFCLTIVEDKGEAINIIAAQEYSLIVAEFSPNCDCGHCFDLVRSISDAPILALVDAADYLDIEPFLKLADDAMLAQFDPQELSIRAKALINNISVAWKYNSESSVRRVYGDLHISIPKFKVTYQRMDIEVTKTEFQILQLLSERPGQVFTREQIYNVVWDELARSYVTKSVNNHVQRLNNKLKKASGYEYIKAKWGIGYYFAPPQAQMRKTG